MSPRVYSVLWMIPLIAFGVGVVTIGLTYPAPPSQLDRIESTLDQTVNFLSDLHAERSACR